MNKLKAINNKKKMNLKSFMPYNPNRWGPPAWDFLYCIAFSYPHKPTKAERQNMIRFLKNLGPILPCIKCRRDFLIQIKSNPIHKATISKKNLVKWMISMKNTVSKKSGVPKSKLDTFDRVCKKYFWKRL